MTHERAEKLLSETVNTYDAIAHHFSQTRFSAGPWIMKITKDVPNDARVLDIGCGNGRLLEGLPKTVRYSGFDVSKNLLALARQKYPQHIDAFQLFNGKTLPFDDNSFSHVYMLATLHHIPQPFQQRLIDECKRVLAPNGSITVSVWHLWRMPFIRYMLQGLFSEPLDLFDLYVPWKESSGAITGKRYFHMFRKRELLALFKKAGFKDMLVTVVPMKNQKNYVITARS